MKDTLNQAPPVPEPKENKVFRFDPLPESGVNIFTLLDCNFIRDYENRDYETKEVKIYDAIELFFGTVIDGKQYFLKPWPTKYSIHPKSTYFKIVKAMTQEEPQQGSTPADFFGQNLLITTENVNKKSKAGKSYVATKIVDYNTAPDQMKKLATPAADFEEEFRAALTKADQFTDGAPQAESADDVPF
jgi:hypothetical protein